MDNDVMKEKSDDKLRIFISHKLKDGGAAEKIKNALRYFGPYRLDFFLSEEIQFGQKWEERVHDALKHSDWLLLLYTDPADDWDWCLYETGFFAAAKEEKSDRRLVCLHREKTDPPGPIRRWQPVPAVHNRVVKLTKEILCDPPRLNVDPINPDLRDDHDRLDIIAESIVKAVGPQTEREQFTNYLILSLDARLVESLEESGEVPGEAKVESNESSLAIFGRRPGECTWEDLMKGLQGPEHREWITQLGRAMQTVSSRRTFRPALPLVRSPEDNKVYRPLLHSLDRLPGTSQRACILFFEVPPEDVPVPGGRPRTTSPLPMPDEGPVPGSRLATIFDLLKMGFMFRRGVIKPYQSKLADLRNRNAPDVQIKEYLARLESAYIDAMREAERRLLFDEDHIMAAFVDQAGKIKELDEKWGGLREQLNAGIKAKNLDGVIEALKEIGAMNKEFLMTAGKRLPELLSEELY